MHKREAVDPPLQDDNNKNNRNVRLGYNNALQIPSEECNKYPPDVWKERAKNNKTETTEMKQNTQKAKRKESWAEVRRIREQQRREKNEENNHLPKEKQKEKWMTTTQGMKAPNNSVITRKDGEKRN